MKESRLWKMTWPEVKVALENTSTVLIPVGAIEQHGPHLPIDTDVFISQRLCELAAKRSQEEGAFISIAHPINYGVSWYHNDFPGTVAIPQKIFIDYVFEVCKSLYKHGVEHIVFLNAHGGNLPALSVISNLIHERLGKRNYVVRWMQLAPNSLKKIVSGGIHAGEEETSLALALGQTVYLENTVEEAFNRYETLEQKGESVSQVVKYDNLHQGPSINVSMDYTKDLSQSGIIGDATKANIDYGKQMLDEILENLVQFCKEIHSNNDE